MKFDFAGAIRRFDALARRERVLVFAALVCLVVGAAFAGVIDPALLRSKALKTRIAEHRSQLLSLEASRRDFESQMQHDVNAEIRGRLEAAKNDLASLDEKIKGFHQTLIPAQSMAKVLSGMLERSEGVQLISLRNIAPEPLSLDDPKRKRAADVASAGVAPVDGLLYKHGIELVVEGGYFELLNYLSDLEKQPWRMIWAETSLTAEYPRSRLRLKLHTLSMDPTWLTV